MKRDALALAMVFAAILLFTHEAWLGGLSPFGGDIAEQFYPWKSFERAQLAQGQVPYWNPYAYAGAPFLANVQSAVFYLFDWVLFLFPMERFFGLSLTLHFLIAGAGAYCFARICGATQFPSMISGVAYALSGFTMIHIPFGNHLTYAGAAWAPWTLFAATGFLFTKERRLLWTLGGAAIVFLHFTCGHPQMLFYSMLFSLIFVFVLQSWRVRRDGAFNWKQPVWMTTLWGCVLLLGVLMASFQLISTLEYLSIANRAEALDVAAATEFSFAPHRLITLLFPEFYGTHIAGNHYDPFYFWSCAYAGVIVPFLALSMFRKGERPVAAVPLAVIALLGLFMAWGWGNPVYPLLLHLPGIGHFRAPAKYLPYYLAPVCVLASLGLERLSQEAYQKFTLKTQSKAAKEAEFAGLAPSDKTVAGLRVFGLLVVFGVVYLFGAPHLYQRVDALRNQRLAPDEMAQNINNIKMYSSTIGAVLLLSAMTIYLYARKVPKSPRAVLSFSLFVFLCFDLFLFGRQYFLVSLYSVDEIRASVSAPAAVKYIKSMPDYKIEDRIQTLDDVRAPNLAILWKIPNTAGYDPMSLKSYNQELSFAEGWKNGEYHDDINLKKYDHPVLDELNVRFILTDSNRAVINDPVLKPLFTGPRYRVYERTSENRAWASTALRPNAIDRKEMDGALYEVAQWSPAQVNVASYQPQEILFNVDVSSPVWLRVSEWDYPNWRARIGSGEERLKPLHDFSSKEGFRTYAIDPGRWTLHIDYVSPWGRWLLTALAWIVFAKLGAIAYLLHTGRFWAFVQRALGRYY